MAWAFVNSATGVSGNTVSVSVTYPASINAGDLLVYFWAQGNTATTQSAEPSGITQVGSEITNGDRRYRIYYRVADGTETGSITWTVSASVRQTACILHYSGTHATPLDVAGTPNTTASATTINAPSVTTTAANDLVVRIASLSAAGGSITGVPATSRVNFNDGAVVTALADENVASAGATGTAAFSGSTGAWIGQTVAFKEAVAGGAKPWHYYQQMMGAA